MTEQEGSGQVVTGSLHLSAGSSEFRESSAQGQQTFSVEVSREIQRSADAQHRREEQRKDNDARRHRENVLFYVVIIVMVACLLTGFAMITMSENTETRRTGQSIVTLILGAVAGYFTGRAGK
jgi:hypothetical protein